VDDARTEEFGPFLDMMKDGAPFLCTDISDAEAVLSASHTLDVVLRIAIGTAFRVKVSSNEMRGIFETGGSLAGLDSKVRIASAFGILQGDFRHDADIIRAVRNMVAHSIVVRTFVDDDIYGKCAKLKCSAPLKSHDALYVRNKFVASCVRLIQFILTSTSFTIVANALVDKNKDALQPAAIMVAVAVLKEAGMMDQEAT